VVYVDSTDVPADAVADVDGNIYSTVVIGNQRWMAENLRTSHYTNGDPIPYVPDAQWSLQSGGAWTNYDTDASYDELFGKLYNWYTVVDPRNVCPNGWHVPTDSDWMDLEAALGMPLSELGQYGWRGSDADIGGHLKAVTYWNTPNTGADDSSGFSAYPGGMRLFNGTFLDVGSKGVWWSSSEYSPGLAWLRELNSVNTGVSRQYHFDAQGCSIRCVHD
jgi:uncharacterized protein (TIGR02145 family)